MNQKLKSKFDILRIEALEAELSKITNAAAEVITELKDFKETSKIAINTLTEIIEDKNKEIAFKDKKIKDLEFTIELKEGRFISSQKVVRDLRAGFKI